MKYSSIDVKLPKHDVDVIIEFPGGKQMVISVRPSNADYDHNGSLDIILPENDFIAVWKGDYMESSLCDTSRPNERFGKQMVTRLPGEYF